MISKKQKMGILVAAAIICAVAFRVATKLGFASTPLGIARSLIYIALYAGWGVSVSRRILQPQVRRALIAVSCLCVFWFVVRSMKYFLVTDLNIARYLWYSYYFPMLFIPLASVFVALSLGKPENYRLPKGALFLCVPTAALLLMVLTNDLHRLVFTFPEGQPWTDDDYGYGFGYYLVFGWELACAVFAFAVMLAKSRLAQKGKHVPAILLAVAVVYAAIYASGAEWMQLIGGDIAAAQCLMFVGILESCIRCGLIQTNTGYGGLFMVSSLGAQITDAHNIVHLASSNARSLTEEQRLQAKMAAVALDSATLVKSKPIRFGWVIWQEDVAELTEAIGQIEENCCNLAERNRIHRENYETQKKILALQEKNRAADMLHSETAQQIALINEFLASYDAQDCEDARMKLLAGVAVVGAYIKRYGNLLLVSEQAKTTSMRDLARCFEDSFANLEFLGVECLCTLPGAASLSSETALRIYCAFENVLEDCLFNVRQIWVNAREKQGQTVLTIDFSCGTDLSKHASDADGYSCDEDSSRFSFALQKGGAPE